jgi:hypothetical protein
MGRARWLARRENAWHPPANWNVTGDFGFGLPHLRTISPVSWQKQLKELHQLQSQNRPADPLLVKKHVLIFLLLLLVPLSISTVNYLAGDRRANWQTADRSSAGILPQASAHPDAVIRVFAARTVRWRGIFAVHTWIVVKERNASRYRRYDYTAWGEPIRIDGFAPDGRWFGALPETVISVEGEEAEKLIPKIHSVIETYKFRAYGDYSPWPGPNSNTFIQAALDAVPELKAVLPPTAVGKDYPIMANGMGSRLQGPACSFRSAATSALPSAGSRALN